jgi:ABC-2 type transport system ATP-binding protein
MNDHSNGLPRPQLVVETSALTRTYGTFTAVDHMSFSVHAGEIFGLIGPNGAGKSTLIKMLTTMLPPTSGHATVAGFDIAKAPAFVRRRIGYVPQVLSADRDLTGYENLLLSSRLYLIPRPQREPTIQAALTMMGLSDVRDRLARTYSGGMLRPAGLFLDEPTVGLDPDGRNTVWHHIQELVSKPAPPSS